jgi:glutathione synthase/RimK-type ligase-like ATP-grasp enzyme
MPAKRCASASSMDPIGSINPKKDSTLAMLLGAMRRGWSLHYMEQRDLSARDGKPYAEDATAACARRPARLVRARRGDVRRRSAIWT